MIIDGIVPREKGNLQIEFSFQSRKRRSFIWRAKVFENLFEGGRQLRADVTANTQTSQPVKPT